jgi:hypothetical protein
MSSDLIETEQLREPLSWQPAEPVMPGVVVGRAR